MGNFMFHVKHTLFAEDDSEQLTGGGSPTEDGGLAKLAAKLDGFVEKSEERGAATDQALGQIGQFLSRQQPKPQANDDVRAKANEEFFNDPLKATQQAAQQAAHAAAHAATQQLRQERWQPDVEAAKTKVRGADPKLWDKYEDEIKTYVQQYEAGHWTNPETWNQAVNSVKAKHMDDIFEERRQLQERDPDGPGVPSPKGSPGAVKEDALSEGEQKAADIFQMTDDEYKKSKKEYEADQDAPQMGRGMLKSSWADVILFDSAAADRKAARNAS